MESGSDCRYIEADLRQADFGAGHDLDMLVYGEFNTFRPADARRIVEKAHAALAPGGCLLLEISRASSLRKWAADSPSWYSSVSGLFSDRPHLCLQDHHWDDAARAMTTRYFVVDGASAEVTRYAESHQAYAQAELTALLQDAGFSVAGFHPALTGEPDSRGDFEAVVARRQVHRFERG